MAVKQWRQVMVSVGMLVCSTAVPVAGQVLEPEALQRKQEDQQCTHDDS